MKKGDLTTTDEIDKYIVYLGKVDINGCPSLYVQSHYMFLPTLLECFSASYAEAMRMETIVLTSDLGFARGICNDAAVYFDPLDPIDIVNNLLGIDEDDVGQKLLKHNGVNRLKDFDTAAERAAKYLEIIKNS
jgi:glycosyltransferase involved in cell wall biosynthesis